MTPRDSGHAGGSGRVEDEEDELELPAFDGGDEDAPAPEGDPDVDVEADGAAENVGLDATEGVDEPLDQELGVTEADESTRWIIDSEEARDVDAEADLLTGDEYGWTDANDPHEEPDLDDDIEPTDGESVVSGDRGEEGPEESEAGEGDLVSLPPLDSGSDDDLGEDEPFALEVLRELTGGAVPEEPEPGASQP